MRRQMNYNSLANLRKFGTLPPDEQSELSRRGGIASGKRRRDKAEALDVFNDSFMLMSLRSETRENYQAAIKRYAKQEARKRKRRKRKAPDE